LPKPYTLECAHEFIARAAGRRDPGQPVEWAIVDPDSDELWGSIGFVRVDAGQQSGEVGFWLAPHARGRGVATRALRGVARWGLRQEGFQRVEVAVNVDNLASQAVAERVGFVREGVLRSWRRTGEGRADFVIYSLLPADLT
jgi:RimJ/RimL family protein N-acetyltransferase